MEDRSSSAFVDASTFFVDTVGLVADTECSNHRPWRGTCPQVDRGWSTRRTEGYAATVESSVVTFRDSVDNGARPGRLVRGRR